MTLLHFEDFPVGRVFDCGSYQVTKEEIFDFAREFDPQPHHLDEEAAKHTLLKGLSASGWHVCAIAMRLLADAVLNKAANRGGAGAPEARWIRPVRPGDVLRMEAEVRAMKASSSKPFGFITLDCRLYVGGEQTTLVTMTPIVARRTA